MKKKFLSVLLVLTLITSGVSAKSLVLTLSDGTLVYYLLQTDNNPMMRFTDGGFTLNADAYEFSGVTNFYISATDDPTSIKDIEKSAKNIVFSGNSITINGSTGKVSLVSSNGMSLNVEAQTVDEKTFIDITTLPTGTYIVKAGESSLKFKKK